MTPDRSDATVVTITPETGAPRRHVFEPISDGTYWRVEEVRTGGAWRFVGRERVASVAIEGAAEVSA